MYTSKPVVYCAHPISGMSPDEVFAYYERVQKDLSKWYNVLIPMTGKGSLRTAKEFRASGQNDNKDPITSNHAIFERDKWMVLSADVIYVNLTRAVEHVSVGSMFELAWASLKNRYTVVAMGSPNIHQHAFVLEAADVVFPTEEEAEDYLRVLAGGSIDA